jgi:hypothetical protein
MESSHVSTANLSAQAGVAKPALSAVPQDLDA